MDMPSFSLKFFEGPLDLLLHLIAKNKLNIYDINISELLDQYMLYINAVNETTADISSEFLEMASRLVYIKTVSLLPNSDEADALKSELSGELLEYRVCRMIAERLSSMSDGADRFVRDPLNIEPDNTYLRSHPAELLVKMYLAAAGRGMRRIPPSENAFSGIVKRVVISVSSRMTVLLSKLKNKGRVRYNTLFDNCTGKSEAVATFLAVLELIKTNRAVITGSFDEPTIELVKNYTSIDG